MTFPRENGSVGASRRRRALVLAEAALGRYGLSGARLRFLGESGFKDVFHVSAPEGGEYVLRMYDTPPARQDALHDPLRDTLRSPDTLRAQLLWLSALREETGLCLPEPVPTTEGSLVGHVSAGSACGRRSLLGWMRPRRGGSDPGGDPDRHFVLLRWLDGRQKKEDLYPSDLSLAGSSVARLHRHSDRYSALAEGAFPRWDWHWSFGEATPLWSKGEAFYSAREMGILQDTARRVSRELRELDERGGAFGLIHWDLQPKNFVFRENEVGIIDFDLCGQGYYLFDLTVTLLALKNLYGRSGAPIQRAFLESYHAERPLPQAYPRRLPAFAAMLTAASIRRALVLLDHGTPEQRAQRRRFLSNAVKRLDNFDVAMQPLVGGPSAAP